MLTLDKAIEIYEKGAKLTWNGKPTVEAEECQQMVKWLKDYKRLLGAIEAIKTDIEEFLKQPDFGDLSVGVSCGAIKCIEIINKHTRGGSE